MEIKIDAASLNLDQYKTILEKYNFIGDSEEGTIEINSFEALNELANELNQELIYNKKHKITIYDDWVE